MPVTIFTDGAARGNPGPGGYGVVIVYPNQSKVELSQGYKKTTNNRMELLAAIRGLSYLSEPSEVILYSDSKYLIDSFNKGWLKSWKQNDWKTAGGSPVKNQDMWRTLLSLITLHKVEFHWVKGHDGNPYNERCDRLAVMAAESKDLLPDKETVWP